MAETVKKTLTWRDVEIAVRLDYDRIEGIPPELQASIESKLVAAIERHFERALGIGVPAKS